jgi:hypothetical protein
MGAQLLLRQDLDFAALDSGGEYFIVGLPVLKPTLRLVWFTCLFISSSD